MGHGWQTVAGRLIFSKQIFAIAHELYHFFTKTGSHLSRQDGQESDLVEAKANWFAAEFLLPEKVPKRCSNTTTKTTGSSPKAIETILRNFEDNLIDEDTCISMLGLFGKSPADYGYENHDFIEG